MNLYNVTFTFNNGRTTLTSMQEDELKSIVVDVVDAFTLLPDHWVRLDEHSLAYSRNGIITTLTWQIVE